MTQELSQAERKKAANKRYSQTAGGKAALARAAIRFQQSENGKATITNYNHTDVGKDSNRKKAAKWREFNVIKEAARAMVRSSIGTGDIIKPTNCEVCGVKPIRLHGHHDNYNYPLIVRWLCPQCHKDWHKLNGGGING